MDYDLDIGTGLFSRKDQLLLACSGGPDSVCLFHLLLNSGYSFAVAHVNYQLRAEESDADEQFVLKLCQENGIHCHTHKANLSSSNQRSIQAEARKIRYDFFESLMNERALDFLLTAHHAGDLTENALFRFIRGTGLRGLQSFSQVKGNIIRPLLGWSKAQILEYLERHKYRYRTDESNQGLKYSRNKIRNLILPAMEEDLPNIQKRIGRSTELLQADYDLIQTFMQIYIKQLQSGQFSHDCDQVILSKAAFWFHLFENISAEECRQIATACSETKNGFGVLIDGYAISIIQNKISIIRQNAPIIEEIYLEQPVNSQIVLGPNCVLNVQCKTVDEGSMKNNFQHISADGLSFPLKLRHPIQGDRFQPLGMSGNKLLSDFYNDIGISSIEKEKEWVLTDYHGVILAVLPHRISEQFKITKASNNMLSFELCKTPL